MKDKYDLKNNKFILLSEKTNNSIDTLFKIYKKDKYGARLYYHSYEKNDFKKYRTVLFIKPKNEFEIVSFQKTFGISINNRIYSNEKRIEKLVFQKNKFYRINYFGSKPNINLLMPNMLGSKEWSILIQTRPWMQFLKDNKLLINNISFNKIFSQKLFTEKKLVRYTLDIPLKVYKELKETVVVDDIKEVSIDALFKIESVSNSIKKENIKWFNNSGVLLLKGVLNSKYLTIKNKHLIAELLLDKELEIITLLDTMNLAIKLGETVNFNWSKKRFINTHNKWSAYVTNYILELDNKELIINDIFKQFEIFSDYNLLKTTKELGLEGKNQKHCVATYTSNVNSGNSGIYHVDGYTLELILNKPMHVILGDTPESAIDHTKNPLKINQLKGYKNQAAPIELLNKIKNKLDNFKFIVDNEKINTKMIALPVDDFPF